jgi:hypothetical protein
MRRRFELRFSSSTSFPCHRPARPDDPVNAGGCRLARKFRLHVCVYWMPACAGMTILWCKSQRSAARVVCVGRRGRPYSTRFAARKIKRARGTPGRKRPMTLCTMGFWCTGGNNHEAPARPAFRARCWRLAPRDPRWLVSGPPRSFEAKSYPPVHARTTAHRDLAAWAATARAANARPGHRTSQPLPASPASGRGRR